MRTERSQLRCAKRRNQLFPLRELALLPLVLVLFAGCGGSGNGGGIVGGDPCKPPTETPANFLVVLFDISGSTATDMARSRYHDGFNTVLAAFKEGGGLYGEESIVAIGSIDEKSLVSFDPLQCSYPKRDPNKNPLRYRVQLSQVEKRLSRRAAEIIDGPRERKGTAILDALAGVGRLFTRHATAESKFLVLFSDMIEESDYGSGVRAADCQKHADQLETRLEAVKVYVGGAGVSSSDVTSARLEHVRKFWMCYFGKVGGELPPENYGSTLLGFP